MMELWQVRAASKILNWGKDWTWGVPSGVAYQKLLLCEREGIQTINKLVPILNTSKFLPSCPRCGNYFGGQTCCVLLGPACSPLSPSLTSAVPKVASSTPGGAAGLQRWKVMLPRAFLATFPAHPHTLLLQSLWTTGHLGKQRSDLQNFFLDHQVKPQHFSAVIPKSQPP